MIFYADHVGWMFVFTLSYLTKESEKTMNVANKNVCFYNVLIPELHFS